MSFASETPDGGPNGDLSGSTASPCTSVCQLDGDETCVGCGRTIDEIMGWPRMSAAEKAATNRRAADRRQARGVRPEPG